MRRAPACLLVMAAAACAPAAPPPDPAPALPVTDLEPRLDAIFADWDTPATPGCAVAAELEGERVLSHAYGMADLEHGTPNHPGTIFEAGSVSKQLAAGAVVLLALDGALGQDDAVREHVPEVPDYGHRISIRHLLNHTSGLRDWGSVAALSGWGRSVRTHSHDHVLDILSRQSALNYPPGEEYSYTNSGYNLLAVIVDRVSGTPFAEFSRERIFEPLGMVDTQWRDDYRRLVPGRATAYSPRGDGFVINQPIEHVHGNGGLLTTVGDLLRWDRALSTGELGGPELVDLMHERGVLNDGRRIGYASGVIIGERDGVPQVSHTGATSGYRAFLGRYPEQALSVALLCNVSAANPGQLGGAVVDLFLDELAPPRDPAAGPETIMLSRAELEARTGIYVNTATGAPMELVVEDGALRIAQGPTLTPIAPNVFRIGATDRNLEFHTVPGAERERIVETVADADDRPHEVAAYEPVERFEPTADELASYTGTFRSEDSEATLVLEVKAGELVARRRPADRFNLRPIYADAFESPIGLVRFHRGDGGQIEELGIRQARVHDMRFRLSRSAPPAPRRSAPPPRP